jgi:flavodoxin
MKTVIFYTSTHHGNTAKLAKAMGAVLKAELHDLEKEDGSRLDLRKYDLVGLGSGIYAFNLSPRLFDLVEKLDLKGRRIFVFSTSAEGRTRLHRRLTELLLLKKAKIIGEFACPGFIDWAFFRWFGGGLRKGRPNASDLRDARNFARSLLK